MDRYLYLTFKNTNGYSDQNPVYSDFFLNTILKQESSLIKESIASSLQSIGSNIKFIKIGPDYLNKDDKEVKLYSIVNRIKNKNIVQTVDIHLSWSTYKMLSMQIVQRTPMSILI